jgi:hypothetical protein
VTWQELPPPTGATQVLPVQRPEQQSEAAEQAEAAPVPDGLQETQALTPEPTAEHVPAQQSPGAWQAPPGGAQ